MVMRYPVRLGVANRVFNHILTLINFSETRFWFEAINQSCVYYKLDNENDFQLLGMSITAAQKVLPEEGNVMEVSSIKYICFQRS